MTSPSRKYSFDPKCLELAEYFALDSEWVFKPENLAQDIQDAVEAYFSELGMSNPQPRESPYDLSTGKKGTKGLKL